MLKTSLPVAVALALSAAALAQPAKAPKPASALELANPSMEEGDKAPTKWKKGDAVDGAEYIWDRAAGQDGKSSLCIKKAGEKFFPYATWSQAVPHSGKTCKLKVSAYVKADKVKKAVLDVAFKGTDKHQWAATLGPKNNGPAATYGWKRYEGVVAIPKDAKELVIALQMYGPGTIWIDDVRAEYVPDSTPASLYKENGEPKD